MVSAPSIGVIPTICPFLLPKVLPVLNTHHPQAKLNIVEEQSHLLVETVRRGDLNAAILALPYPYEGLLSMDFWHEDFFWVAPKENPLSQQNAIHSKELDHCELMLLKHCELMLLKEEHCLKDHIIEACKLPEQTTNRALVQPA